MGQSLHPAHGELCLLWATSKLSHQEKRNHKACDSLHFSAPAEAVLPLTHNHSTGRKQWRPCPNTGCSRWGYLALTSLHSSRIGSISHLLPPSPPNLCLFSQPSPPCSPHVRGTSAQPALSTSLARQHAGEMFRGSFESQCVITGEHHSPI